MRAYEQCFVLEGAKLLESALDRGVVPESVYLGDGAQGEPSIARVSDAAFRLGSQVFTLAPGVLERVADTVTPQPIMAVMRKVDVPLEGVISAGGLVVVCADLRDPGNAGTLLRSAAGSGASAVIFCEGSVDPYNPKTVRAAAGALLQIPFVEGSDPCHVLVSLRASGYRCMGATAHGGTDYRRSDLLGRCALVVGNESRGMVPEVAALLDGQVTIPLEAGVESLNVGIAAAILCFEAMRQRESSESFL